MKVGLIGFTTYNLGDDVQSIATSLSLPFVDRLVLRDRFSKLKLDEPHLCVMQSWFSGEKWWAPSPAIDPLFFGYCFGEGLRHGRWPAYLRKYQPIGARDPSSVERMAQLKIAAYWTGCLTLQIGSFLRRVPAEERRGTFMVDVPADAEHLVPQSIREQAIVLSNETPPGIRLDPLARFSYMARICDTLRYAERVVTRRLHTALPCVGFGTPVAVVLPGNKGNRHRFSGFDRFVPVHYYDEKSAGSQSGIDWDGLASVDIPNELGTRYAELRETITTRLGAVGSTQYNDLYQRHRLRIPNPGLGPGSGRVALDFGISRVERVPTTWSDREIVVDLDSFASFERYRIPVLLQPHGRKDWVQAGTVDRLVEANGGDTGARL